MYVMKEESVYDLFKRGEELLNTGNPAQAAVVLERARKQEPDRPSIRETLGRAYFSSGRYVRAAEQFQAVIELYPTDRYAHYCLGRCMEKLGFNELSRRHLRLAKAMGYKEEPNSSN
jgi:tetratricopeptide (TPR) repeat protein